MTHPTRRTAKRFPTAEARLVASPPLAVGDSCSVGIEDEAPLLVVERVVKRQGRLHRLHSFDQAGCYQHKTAPTPGRSVDRRELLQRGTLLVALPPRDGGLVDAHGVGEGRLRHVTAGLPDGGAETDLPTRDGCRLLGHEATLRICGWRIL